MNPSSRRALLPSLLAAALTAVACTDEGPVPGPGTLTATLVSPNGAEGAALVSFFGPGIGEVVGSSGVVHWERHADTLLAVLLDEEGGELAFAVSVEDTTRVPTGVVLEVAGPDDQLRPRLDGYALEFRR